MSLKDFFKKKKTESPKTVIMEIPVLSDCEKTVVLPTETEKSLDATMTVRIEANSDTKKLFASIHNKDMTQGSHGIGIKNDVMLKDIFVDAADTLFLPGGGVGTKNLKACEELSKLLVSHNAKGGRIAAICAAPSALGILGILEGKNATCYPGFEDQLKGAKFKAVPVVTDGNITTSRGMGTSILLGLELVKLLKDEETSKKLAEAIMMP